MDSAGTVLRVLLFQIIIAAILLCHFNSLSTSAVSQTRLRATRKAILHRRIGRPAVHAAMVNGTYHELCFHQVFPGPSSCTLNESCHDGCWMAFASCKMLPLAAPVITSTTTTTAITSVAHDLIRQTRDVCQSGRYSPATSAAVNGLLRKLKPRTWKARRQIIAAT